MALNPITLRLDNNKMVPAVRILPNTPTEGIENALNLPLLHGAVAVVGGAASFDTPEYAHIRNRVSELLNRLAEVAISHRLAIVDGGTPFGAMRLMGEICYAHQFRFPLIGVAPTAKVAWSSSQGIDYPSTWYGMKLDDILKSRQDKRTPLDINHTAFVLVEANNWGDEAEMLAQVAHELSGHYPAMEILVNGGDVARRDIIAYLQKGGEVIVIQGSGRFADELATAVEKGHIKDPELYHALTQGRVHVFPLTSSPELFTKLLLERGRWTQGTKRQTHT